MNSRASNSLNGLTIHSTEILIRAGSIDVLFQYKVSIHPPDVGIINLFLTGTGVCEAVKLSRLSVFMKIPHRTSTRVGLIVFTIILVGSTGWAFVRLDSFIPLFVLAIGMWALWNIARVSLHVEVLSDQLVCYQTFSTKTVSLSELRKIVANSSDEGTVTLYFSESRIRLMQGGKMTRSIIEDILSHRSVEFVDEDNWYSTASKTS